MALGEEVGPGAPVEVRTRFTGEWAPGFEIVTVHDAGVTVRRMRDGRILPLTFAPEEVRLCALLLSEEPIGSPSDGQSGP